MPMNTNSPEVPAVGKLYVELTHTGFHSRRTLNRIVRRHRDWTLTVECIGECDYAGNVTRRFIEGIKHKVPLGFIHDWRAVYD